METRRRREHIDGLHAVATDGLPWCIRRYKSAVNDGNNHPDDVPHLLALDVLVVASAGFAALGLVSALPPGGKAFVVNLCGFVYPASATIRATKQMTTQRDNNSSMSTSSRLSTYSGYWVLFGLSSVFDSVLPAITPYYFCSKACLLAWGASSARPYGGRVVTPHMIELFMMNTPSSKDNNNKKYDDNNNNDDDEYDDDDPVRRKLASITQSVARRASLTLPPTTPSSTLVLVAAAAASFATTTLALGISLWLVVVAEEYLSSRSSWAQATICTVAGACWPLHATLGALARTTAAGGGAVVIGDGGGGCQRRVGRRQGPAAVQWLSYWPIFAFLVVLDPVMGGGWVPHFYSCKLVVLALLALPQTRGAYLITSLVNTHGNNNDTSSATKGKNG